MRTHTANELRFRADILGADGSTVLASGVACGLEDVAGKVLEQSQLSASVTTHVALFRAADASTLTDSGYIRVDGVLYIMDYRSFPNKPRPNIWVEAYCHAERSGS